MKARKRAIWVGILFVLATVSSSLGFALRDSILDAPDLLVQVAANAPRMLAGGLLVLIDCVTVAAIPVVLYPILKAHSKAWALGYLGFRTIESVVIVLGEVCLLTLLSLSRAYVAAGAPDAAHWQTLGALFPAAYRYATHVIGILIVFGLTAVILNVLLIRARLVPRWISIWGLVGAAVLLATGLIELLGPSSLSAVATYLSLPFAVQEMVYAVWLIVKGFNPSAQTTGVS
jgi:hypothetical protein